MNHGRGFWAERNKFAGELRGLWEKGYTGEGFWGQGRELESLRVHAGNMVDVGVGREVEGLCGGTFRSRGRKRRRRRRMEDGKGALTWREQRDRRIEKKFGRNGVALGEDEDARIKLEIGKKGTLGGKPRVAGSKRGRELRAAAALARFETQKEEQKAKKEMENEEDEDSSTTDSDEPDDDQAGRTKGKPAVDINGNQLLDSMGFTMVKVCGDEDTDDINVKKEMDEFELLEKLPPFTEHESAKPNQIMNSKPAIRHQQQN